MKAVVICILAAILLTCAVWADEKPVQNALDQRVTIELKDVPLKQAVDTILKPTGVSYTVAEDAGATKVNAVLRNVPVGTAILQVVNAAGLQVEVAGDQANPVIRIFRGPGEHQSDGSTEPPMVQGLTVKLDATITITTEGKKKPYKLSTESTGADGYPMPLEINSSKTITTYTTYNNVVDGKVVENKVPTYRTEGFWMQCILTPKISPDGSISLSGSGILRGIMPMEFSQPFQVSAIADTRVPSPTIAGGKADLGDMSVEYEVRASITRANGLVPAPKPAQMGDRYPGPVPPGMAPMRGGASYGGNFGGGFGAGGYGPQTQTRIGTYTTPAQGMSGSGFGAASPGMSGMPPGGGSGFGAVSPVPPKKSMKPGAAPSGKAAPASGGKGGSMGFGGTTPEPAGGMAGPPPAAGMGGQTPSEEEPQKD